MQQSIIGTKHKNYAVKNLKKFYAKGLIAPDKKEYLTYHRKSIGPWLAMKSDKASGYMLDAASQIATLGLGFNPSVFFGTTYWQEAWTCNARTENFEQLNQAFKNFLKRKLGCTRVGLRYCHSGAEANEIALGKAYQNRYDKQRNKILAFEGSFHGRMLVSLCSTWNKTKREPFQIPGYETVFTPFPEDKQALVTGRTMPEGWLNYWSNPERDMPHFQDEQDPQLLEVEIECLNRVKEQLAKNEIFATLIEPMQCEGGDRYGTDRFFRALRVLTAHYNVALIMDEVQTGFHLGREFFWHREFALQSAEGRDLYPDYVVCAKKAQVGMVMAPGNEQAFVNDDHEFNVTSVVRGYIHGLSLDQHQENVWQLEVMSSALLEPFCEKYGEFLVNPRVQGMSFAFDFKDKSKVAEWIRKRFDYGLLYYPAGENTLRFRLNLNYTQHDIEFLFAQLDSIAAEVFLGKKAAPIADFVYKRNSVERNYKLSELFLSLKRTGGKGKKSKLSDDLKALNKIFIQKGLKSYNWVTFDKKNINKYLPLIEKLQKEVYEPARQTPTDHFYDIAMSDRGLGMGLFHKKELVGIAFAAPLKEMKAERGVSDDVKIDDPSYIYMQDVTVTPNFKGHGFGKLLKAALVIKALYRGVKGIRGRNRDRYAATMFDINLSLGAVEMRRLENDYPDSKPYRDTLYYTMPTTWQEDDFYLSDDLEFLGVTSLSDKNMNKSLDKMVNKVCLSNFVNEDYLKNLDYLVARLPKGLRHCYAASGQSECVDKLIKSAWLKRKPHEKLLSFKGHFFGTGSFMSRALSAEGDEFFKCDHLENPTTDNWKSVLEQAERALKSGVMGVFIEPILQKSNEVVPRDFLIGLKKLCHTHKTPLVYNETASADFSYTSKGYFAACDEQIKPDMGMQYLGGQMALVFTNTDYFIDKPLWMISTWDGDEFSLWSHKEVSQKWIKDGSAREKLIKNFEKKLSKEISKKSDAKLVLHRGRGFIDGELPQKLQKLFKKQGDRFLISPSFHSMNKFIKEY